METNAEWFRGMVVNAKDGNFDACIDLLMTIILSPFILSIYLISLFGRLLAVCCFNLFLKTKKVKE